MPKSSMSVGPEEMPTCPGLNCPLSQVQTRKEEPLPPAASRSIPTFYFPRGRPQDTVNVDTVIAKIERTFAQFPHERATMEDMGRVAKVGVPVGTCSGPSSGMAGAELGFSASALCRPWGLRHRGLVLSSVLAVGGHDSLRAVPWGLVISEGPSPRALLRPSPVSPVQGMRIHSPHSACVIVSTVHTAHV